jgi:hypothetical protein
VSVILFTNVFVSIRGLRDVVKELDLRFSLRHRRCLMKPYSRIRQI